MGKAHSNARRQVALLPCSGPCRVAHHLWLRPGGCNPPAPSSVGRTLRLTGGTWSNSPLIDVVDINTPNDSHAEIAIAAAQNGKHILCEKPLALTVKQTEQMLAAVKKGEGSSHGLPQLRRIPAIAQAKKMITEGALGKIYHYRARYAQDWPADPEFPLVWRLQKASAAGAHGDINAHIIDLGASRWANIRKSAAC